VVQANARVKRAANRLKVAEAGLADAAETAEKNVLGLGQTRRVGEQLVLVFRPQEAVAAVATLDQAYRDYFAAVADHNRAQFQLYRALGHPAQCLSSVPARTATLPATTVPAPPSAVPPAGAAPEALPPSVRTVPDAVPGLRPAPGDQPRPGGPASDPTTSAELPVWSRAGGTVKPASIKPN
jgi:hypothetical protein